MPGSGKSTVGVILAKLMGRSFIDTDILIQLAEKRSLQDIVDADGYMKLRSVEEDVLLTISCENHVIATGGSAPYSAKGMKHLKQNGIIVFLDADLETLRSRITNYETRGLAKRPGQCLDDLFRERRELYQLHGDIMIKSGSGSQEEVAEQILIKCTTAMATNR